MAALDFPSSPTVGQVYTANGKSWQWDGVSWISYNTLIAAGSNTQIQFNNSGAFGASSNLTWNGSTLATTGFSASDTVTINGGTANGVAYLNGSKVLTTGSGLTFDGSNLGLGVTPSDWASQYKIIEIGGGTSGMNIAIGGSQTASMNLYHNAYRDTDSIYRYKASGYSEQYQQFSGTHAWFTAPSGTAGNAITFTQAMTLDSSGRLGIGTSSPAYKLHINDGAVLINGFVDGNNYLTFRDGFAPESVGGVGIRATDHSGANRDGLGLFGQDGISLWTNATERLRINASGNVGIGTSSPSQKLEVAGVVAATGYNGTYFNGTNVNTGASSGTLEVFGGGIAAGSLRGGQIDFCGGIAASNPGALIFRTGTSSGGTAQPERLRIDSSGNLGLGVTPSAWSANYRALQNGTSSFVRATSSQYTAIAVNVFNDVTDKYISNGYATRYYQLDGTHVWSTAPSGTAGNAITFTQAMTLTAAGNLLVGATSESGKLTILQSTSSNQNTVNLVSSTSSGNGSQPGVCFYDHTAAKKGVVHYDVSSDRIYVTVGTQGVYLNNAGTSWVANTSDERLKNKVSDIELALDAITKLNPLTFYFKDEPNEGTPRYGFFAQNVGEAIPDAMLVSKENDPELGDIYTYDASIINVYMVKAIQELHAEIESLKAKVN